MQKQGKLDDRETLSPNFLDFLGNPVSGYHKAVPLGYVSDQTGCMDGPALDHWNCSKNF